MKVQCIDNKEYEDILLDGLTMMKVYEVVEVTPFSYEVIDDDGDSWLYHKDLFIIVEE